MATGDKAMKRRTRQQAIAAFCKECIYDPHEPGTWPMQVEACTAPLCPQVINRLQVTSRLGIEAAEVDCLGNLRVRFP